MRQPILGKRHQLSPNLRLNLDPKAHLQVTENLSKSKHCQNSSQNADENNNSEPTEAHSNDSPVEHTARKRAKVQLFIRSSLNTSSNGAQISSSSSATHSGCLSPTDSPKLLESSLKKAAEIQKKCRDEGRIGRFCLLSPLDATGFSYHALDTRNHKLKTCQVLSKKQYDHLITVSNRLNSTATNNWPYLDTKEMIARILPADSELIHDASDGKFYHFAEKPSGSLHSFVQTRKKLSEGEARAFFGQIVRLVAFCHAVGIVVRDLKLRKFVFHDEKQSTLRLGSISDLVVCCDISDDRLADRHGCPAYVSPEILDLTQRTYSGKYADIWSLGVMLFVMLIGRYPFYATTPAGLFGKIRQGMFVIPTDEKLTPETQMLLRGLLRRDAAERPTAMTLLKIPWMSRREESLLSEHAKSETSSGSRAQKVKKLGRFVDNDDQVVPVFVPLVENREQGRLCQEES